MNKKDARIRQAPHKVKFVWECGRRYSDKDIDWIAFIRRLKAAGMPIREIRRYAALRAEGDATLTERMDMLIEHRRSLKDQIRQLQEHEARLDEKIAVYQQKIDGYLPPPLL